MSNLLVNVLLYASVIAPLLFAFIVWKMASVEIARRWSIGIQAFSFAAALVAVLQLLGAREVRLSESAEHWLMLDALNAIPLVLFMALCLGITMLAPKHVLTPQWLAGILWLSATTSAAYAANNLLVFVAGWAGSLAPFLVLRSFAKPKPQPALEANQVKREQTIPVYSQAVLWLSLVSLCIGVGLLIYATPNTTWQETFSLSRARRGDANLLFAAFISLMGAVILRKGLFPAHSWVVTAYEKGPLLPLTLMVNDHLGAFLVARIVLPLVPDVAHKAWPFFSTLSLLTALYAAVLALVESKPRRLFALVAISQSAFLLTGLESYNAVGITGSLVLWQVVSVATTMIAAVYTGLEARLGTLLETNQFLGLAVGAPRLAVFFAAGCLALVGLPLTLGFPAEDLLLQGTLASNPYLGVVLPVVTAVNAFSVVRLFARLFLGRPRAAVHNLADALPRERWVLTAALLFLLLGGLFPAPLIRLPAIAATRIVNLVSNQTHTAQLP
jgi:NADH-quinone oxidoreductase subunit M